MKNKDSTLADVVEKELESLETLLQVLLDAYHQRLHTELKCIRVAVEELGTGKKTSRMTTHDLRDMLGLIRQMETKPCKGKRKDLKKIEFLLKDLRSFVSDWEAMKVI